MLLGRPALRAWAPPRRGDRIAVAMSGGVDSSVVAALLAQRDYDVRGVYMRNWSTADEMGSMQGGSGGVMGCAWQKEWHDVQAVARHLGMHVDMIDLSRDYWIHVFEPALEQWTDGSTPNPDVACNRSIKFGALLDAIQAPWLATGHYARIGTRYEGATAFPVVQRAIDATKDQSFFLSSVPSTRLARSLFPLGELRKTYVRRIARAFQLPTSDKDESMGLCFVGERGSGAHAFARFLDQYVVSEPGDFVTPDGRILGRHRGLHTLTIGQRARIAGEPQRYYVARKEAATRRIVVVPSKTHPMLQCTSLTTSSFAWATGVPVLHTQLLAQVRYRQTAVPCFVHDHPTGGSGHLRITFAPSVEAVAPGQSVALYDKDTCLGSGTIEHVQTMA